MPSLHELQRMFGAALASGESAALERHVVANGIDAVARIHIYRNNTREIHLAALRAAFPVLERLVGADYFRQLAFEYRERFPSTSGNLHFLGCELPLFLEHRFAGTEYRYLPDVAKLEWAYQEVLVAAEHAPLAVDRLQRVAPVDYPRLVFRLHPAARLVASPFPVLTIWSANQPDTGDTGTIDLRSGGERVLVLRTAGEVELRRLDDPEFMFLKLIADGATLAVAADAAVNAGAFDLGATLRRYAAAGLLIDFSLPVPTTDHRSPA